MEKALRNIISEGVKLYIKNRELKYMAPQGIMTKEKMDWIKDNKKDNKKEILSLIEKNSIKVWSEIVKEEIIIIRGKKYSFLVPFGVTFYTLYELEVLKKKNPEKEFLEKIHQAKKELDGFLID